MLSVFLYSVSHFGANENNQLLAIGVVPVFSYTLKVVIPTHAHQADISAASSINAPSPAAPRSSPFNSNIMLKCSGSLLSFFTSCLMSSGARW